MLSNLRPSNNTCVAEADAGCHCYRHLFKSLEEQLDIILVWPAKPRNNLCASQLLRDIVTKLPYCSNATGHWWLSFMGSIEEAASLENSLSHLVTDFDLRYE